MEIFETTPMSLQVAAFATSLDKIKIEPVDSMLGNLFTKTKVRVWFPGEVGSSRVANVCADNLNEDIDIAIRDYNAKIIEVGTLAKIIKRNWWYADIIMEYRFRY